MCKIKMIIWFAWYPVKTISNNWIWLKYTIKQIDYRPEIYLGLLPEIKYINLNPIKK